MAHEAGDWDWNNYSDQPDRQGRGDEAAQAPQGFELASVRRRMCAWAIDGILAAVLLTMLIPFVPQLGESHDSCNTNGPCSPFIDADYALMNTVPWLAILLPFATAWSAFGVGPGGLVAGVQVVDSRGRRPGLRKGFARGFVCTVLGPLTFGITFVAAGWTSKRQTWHDVLSGTFIVESP